MTTSITIRIPGTYASISELDWADIPPFAVLTGVNGAGKSQLLEVIADNFRALRRPSHIPALPMPPVPVHVEGDSYFPGQVFHSYGEWPNLSGGSTNEDTVKKVIHDRYNSKHDESFWQLFAARLNLDVPSAKQLSLDEFHKGLTPAFLWGLGLPATHYGLSFLFLAYALFDKDARAAGVPEDRILELYGEAPWDLMNEVLEASGLLFRVNHPTLIRPTSLVYPQDFHIQLHDIERDLVVPFETLSSGERVIMSTALWRYNADLTGKHYRLLLLDEPDAHLHPSLTRRFLNVIKKVFVEARGVRVIMTTHSPSTVALAPAESLFEMRRTAPRIVPVLDKAKTIATLTGGFVTVQEGTQTIFVEGPTDPPFYQQVWDLLTERSSVSDPGPLEPYPNLSFVHGLGKSTVQAIVPQLRARGLRNFHGLIDRDTSSSPSDGVHVLHRNGMENYLFDPLSVWTLLHARDCAPVVPRVSVPKGRSGAIRNLTATQLQAIVDTVLGQVTSRFPVTGGVDLEDVAFQNGVTLRYPRWFLEFDDKTIAQRFRDVFTRPSFGDDELRRSFATLNLVPMEFVDLFRTIQSGAAS